MAAKRNSAPKGTSERFSGSLAKGGGVHLTSMAVGCLPLVNEILSRMRLEEFLSGYLPRSSRSPGIPYAIGVELLVRNILCSREPVYGVGDWAEDFAPDLLGLTDGQVKLLNDDRVGRCLDKLFASDISSLTLAVTGHVVREFEVNLDELHNDSTTVTFHGRYEEAYAGAQVQGKETRAITWGHNKDHRPDLKQLLFILTASRDGGVPLYFTAADGNLTDDQTHRFTWDLLCHIAGRSDFLYVADSKLATQSNREHIHQKGGRFVTILPRTRKEDRMFRERVRKGAVRWKSILERKNKKGLITEEVFTDDQPMLSSEGYRIHWLRSSRKEGQDRATRQRALDRAWEAFAELRERLASPRTRFRTHSKVEEAAFKILDDTGTRAWIEVRIYEYEDEQFRQVQRGRSGPKTTYRRMARTRYDVEVELNQEALEQEAIQDGIFPVITNDQNLSVREVLAAYKRQPVIEKRFSQLKSELAIAPVYLHNAGRIEALLCVYFFALLTQTLLEREARRKMAHKGVPSLPLYHENRASKQPTARRVMDAFGNVQRHLLLQPGSRATVELITDLSPLQRQILEILDIPPGSFGRQRSSMPQKTQGGAR